MDAIIFDQILNLVFGILALVILLILFAWILVNFISSKLSNPIDELLSYVQILRKISKDTENEDDLVKLISLASAKDAQYSKELNTLFNIFDKSLNGLRLCKEAQ